MTGSDRASARCSVVFLLFCRKDIEILQKRDTISKICIDKVRKKCYTIICYPCFFKQ